MASGSGSNYEAILQATHSGVLPLDCPLLISNTPSAGALHIAVSHGCSPQVLNPRMYPSESHYTDALLGVLREHRIDYVALAGYLRKIPAPVVTAFRHRMVNIHPALLPAFGGKGLYGRRVHAAVLQAGVAVSGATVHFVDEHYDTGPIILQQSVPVLAHDTPSSLAARVLAIEHVLYPRALRLLALGRVRVQDRTVTILPDHD